MGKGCECNAGSTGEMFRPSSPARLLSRAAAAEREISRWGRLGDAGPGLGQALCFFLSSFSANMIFPYTTQDANYTHSHAPHTYTPLHELTTQRRRLLA